jgi:phage anti-repressor protein
MAEMMMEQLKQIACSTEQYPVDFDRAWQWVEYARKDYALDALKANFEEGMDYSGLNRNRSDGKPGKPYRAYFLTVDCFKAFCMMAGTEKGKEVRKYYLRIEKEYFDLRKQIADQQPSSELSDEWKKNFPYPFLLLEDAAVKMREMRLGIAKGVVSAKEYRRVVLGDFGRPCKPDVSIVSSIESNLKITGNEKDFVPVEEIYRRYELQTINGLSRNRLTRNIRNIYPALVYKQKKIDGYPVLVFFGCKLLDAPAPAKEALNG